MVDEIQSTPSLGIRSFEDLKSTNEHGAEYWSARDLQTLLGYGQWRRFEEAIQRAMQSCEQSGNSPTHHFAGAPWAKVAIEKWPTSTYRALLAT